MTTTTGRTTATRYPSSSFLPHALKCSSLSILPLLLSASLPPFPPLLSALYSLLSALCFLLSAPLFSALCSLAYLHPCSQAYWDRDAAQQLYVNFIGDGPESVRRERPGVPLSCLSLASARPSLAVACCLHSFHYHHTHTHATPRCL
jgi:hypothetical protein